MRHSMREWFLQAKASVVDENLPSVHAAHVVSVSLEPGDRPKPGRQGVLEWFMHIQIIVNGAGEQPEIANMHVDTGIYRETCSQAPFWSLCVPL